MFAAACTNAREFTRPVIISQVNAGAKCSSGIGCFVVINEEGWIVTAHHIIQSIVDLNKRHDEYLSKRKLIEDIEADQTLKPGQRQSLLNKNKINDSMLKTHSVWWGWDGVTVSSVYSIPHIDLAICKLENFDKSWVRVYPEFKEPSSMEPGSSLCKMGFPFHAITPTYDENIGFILPPGSVPPPFFPLEGIYTRTVFVQSQEKLTYPLKFIETSSPGLRGQSGGPTFDIHGNIWAIQSQTSHLKLGFGNSGIKGKEQEYLNNQYIHVGLGIHSETIIGLLRTNNINFNLSL